ncbi:Transcriptional corepressor SEUSS [Apostasia shenzhenica]|uniref:Transcriptional corepressor SEUSS n=1 Tax=Apostasia shenzhenica TaxID=1088818 RepID=A0A2H9ZTE0_9ASPA|nr:Transcriptional corepressor SEUSS [Apostasia shenzhenica]
MRRPSRSFALPRAAPCPVLAVSESGHSTNDLEPRVAALMQEASISAAGSGRRKIFCEISAFVSVYFGRTALALEGYLESTLRLAANPSPSVALSRVAGVGGPSHSSSASAIFFQGDGQSPSPASSFSGTVRSGFAPSASGGMNPRVLNSAANSSGPSMGASSLVTDANSSLSGGPQLQRSSSINNESLTHLPASPLSFSSNNISNSSVIDGSSLVQQSPQQEKVSKRGASINSSQSVLLDAGVLPAEKRPRLDMRPGDIYQQQVIQQMLQRHQNPQMQTMIHQQRMAQQQQQILQSLPQIQRMQMQQQSQQPRPSPMQLVSPMRRSSEIGLCARRLMQYMYHQSHRPADNSITYWRKFVVEYFAPRAKKRPSKPCFFCRMHGNVAYVVLNLEKASVKATYEVLPRLNQIKFDHGVIDELLYLEVPREGRLPSGMMVLEYAKAVQESVYEQIRVVHEGKLRIIFTPDLKILSWEFCAHRHEELIPRRMMGHQISEVVNSMKDLIDFGQANKLGPIDSLKNFPKAVANKIQAPNLSEVAQASAVQSLPTEQTNERLISIHQGHINHPAAHFLNNSSQITVPPNSYQYLSRNSSNLDHNPLHSDTTFTGFNQVQALPFQGNAPTLAGQTFQGNLPQIDNNQTPSQANQHLQQHMIQQLLQEMMNNKGAPPQVMASPVVSGNVPSGEPVSGCGSNIGAKGAGPMSNGSGICADEMPSTSDTSKPVLKNNSFVSSNSYKAKFDVLENMNFGDLDPDILREFTEDAFQW